MHNFIDYVGSSHTHLQWCLIMFSQCLQRCWMWDNWPEALHHVDQLLPWTAQWGHSFSHSLQGQRKTLQAPSAVAASLTSIYGQISVIWTSEKEENPKGQAQIAVTGMSMLKTLIHSTLRQVTLLRWSSSPKTSLKLTGAEYISGSNLSTVKWAAQFVKNTVLLPADGTIHQF